MGIQIVPVDSESTGLDPRRDKLLMVQVEERPGQPKAILTESEWMKLKPMLEDPNVLKVLHNAQHDIPLIYNASKGKIFIRPVADTMLQEKVLLGVGTVDEKGNYVNIPAALKPMYTTALEATLERRDIAILDKELQKSFIGQTTPITKAQIEYGLTDVKHLRTLYSQQTEELQARGLQTVADLENECVEAISMMKINGIKFDKGIWLQECERWKVYCDAILEELPAHINWGSHAQIKRFFKRRGITIESLSDLDDSYKGLDPLLDKLIALREGYAYTTTFGVKWLTDKAGRSIIHDDGRVRVSYNQIVSTGRTSSSDPNGQNIPKLEKANHRMAFVAERGWKLCIADFEGQELGIMAIGAGEESWIKAMMNHEDIHSVVARILFGRQWDEKAEASCSYPFKCSCKTHKTQRGYAKNINFGLAYGKGIDALAVDMGVTREEAQVLMKLYFQRMPKIKSWLERNGRYAVNFKEAYTLPPFNRYRNLSLEPIEWRRRNQGKNTPVQGSGADVLKVALVYIHRYIMDNNLQDKVKLCMQIHDEIVTEVRNDFAKQWVKIKQKLMYEAAMVVTEVPVIHVSPFLATWWKKEEEDEKLKRAA